MKPGHKTFDSSETPPITMLPVSQCERAQETSCSPQSENIGYT